MIFTELVLENFGVYKGRHALDLSPRGRKNVVLIGALNGAGKTTLLDSIQLAMHGKLASCSNRGSSAYDDYLRRCINRDTDSTDGAAVELTFTNRNAGEDEEIRVRRSWSAPNGKVRESLSIYVNDELDTPLTESWPEHAETFLPSGLSSLFLFDGEKIERLADPNHSADMLKTAVHTLLGLDVVDQLNADLLVLNRRKQENLSDSKTRNEIAVVEKEIQQQEQARSDLIADRASLLNRKTRAEKRLGDATERYRRDGGSIFEQRAEIEARRSTAKSSLAQAEDQMREIASEDAPLLLVRDQLVEISDADSEGQLADQAKHILSVVGDRDQSILEFARAESASNELLKKIDSFLTEDRAKRSELAEAVVSVRLPMEEREALHALLGSSGERIWSDIDKATRKFDAATSELDSLDRMLATVPNEDAIDKLSKVVDTERDALLLVDKELGRLEIRIDGTNRSLTRLSEQRERLLTKNVDAKFSEEDTQRVVEHATRLRETMGRYRTALLDRNLKKLSGFVLESYRHLLRKDSLVNRVEIDRETFEITLTSPNGSAIRTDRLSAGERQLLATAVLWGLARAAGQVLPMVIDTPLGRLDSLHRTKLVERYFPHASHQVILLSTDEEIDDRYYPKLKPAIARDYTLVFDDESRNTRVEPEYLLIGDSPSD